MPHEPALLTSAAMDGEAEAIWLAQSASRERSPGWAQRTSGDGAWVARSRIRRWQQAARVLLAYNRLRSRLGFGGPSIFFLSSARAVARLFPAPAIPFSSLTPVCVSLHS